MENLTTILKKFNDYHAITVEELEKLEKQYEQDREEYEKEQSENSNNNQSENESQDVEKIDVFSHLGINPDQINTRDSKEKDDDIDNKKNQYTVSAPPRVSEDELSKLMQNLNKKQREICMHVLHSFKIGRTNELIVIQGSAGTGKSFLIKTLDQLMTKYFDNVVGTDKGTVKVLLSAPTGVAAYLIGGKTCHSAFKFPINKYKHKEIAASTISECQAVLRNVKILIVDEMSLFSGDNAMHLDKFTRKVTGNENQEFGGLCVILVGDFLQIPPVMGRPIYQSPQSNDPFIYLQHLLWGKFKFFELDQVMRQKDSKFITALKNCALSEMTDEDVKLIQSRIFSEDAVPKDALRLYYTNDSVNLYNKKRINETPGTLHEVHAIDTIQPKTLAKKTVDSMLEKYQDDKFSSTLMPYKLPLKLEIKYMVVKNLDPSDGLANGNIGVLKHISFDPKNEKNPKYLWLSFDDKNIGSKMKSKYLEFMKLNNIPDHLVPFEKETAEMTSCITSISHEAYRFQFPLKPAEASTIHKAQGTTCKSVCVDFSKNHKGMTASLKYVALSRCDYHGLYILGNFNKPEPKKQKDKNVVEIERLRREQKLSLSYYNFDAKKGKSVIYHNINSFNKHKLDVLTDEWYQNGDVIILAESNVDQVDAFDFFPSY